MDRHELRARRERLGLTQEQLAAAMRYRGKNTIWRKESGARTITERDEELLAAVERRHREGNMNKRGVTLMEIIVVVAIIGILTAIAVPTLNRVGVFGRDPLNVATRQVLTLLKAARAYAGTHNVDTAVVYAVETVQDSVTLQPVQVLTGAALVRRLKREEVPYWDAPDTGELDPDVNLYRRYVGFLGSEPLTATDPSQELLPYVFVKRGFQRFQQGAVIGSLKPEASPDLLRRFVTEWSEESGLWGIRIIEPDSIGYYREVGQTVETADSNKYQPGPPGRNREHLFPAHTFKGSGLLQYPSSYERSRFLVEVIHDPASEPQDRLATTEKHVPAELVEIFASTGRCAVVE